MCWKKGNNKKWNKLHTVAVPAHLFPVYRRVEANCMYMAPDTQEGSAHLVFMYLYNNAEWPTSIGEKIGEGANKMPCLKHMAFNESWTFTSDK